VKDIVTVTFTNDGDNSDDDNGAPTIKLTGLKFNVGAGVATGALNLKLTADGTGTAPTLATPVKVGDIRNSKLTVSSIVTGKPGTALEISTVTASDVTKNAINGVEIVFKLNNGTWTKEGKLTGPSGVTFDDGDIAGGVLTFKVKTGTIPTAANTYTLKGAKAKATAAGLVSLEVKDKDGNPVGGNVDVISAVDTSRIGGVDRYTTAAQLYDEEFKGNDEFVLVSGENFPDALSASYLASSEAIGVLLTKPNSLPQEVSRIIARDEVETVYIVGGTAAVSTAVENQIKAMHVGNNPSKGMVSVVRYAGADRYATNAAVNLYDGVGSSNRAIVATGANFADALVVGPMIWNEEYPLVLTNGASLSASARTVLVNMEIDEVVIVGGTSAVSENVEKQISDLGITIAHRIAGADRTETAALIAEWAVNGLEKTSKYDKLDGLGFDSATAHIARGDNFADALAAGMNVGSKNRYDADEDEYYFGQVILLSGNPNSLGGGAATYLNGKAGEVTGFRAIGLTGAVSNNVLNQAAAALAG
jgi:putative cell wall-binding protein